VLTTDTVTVEGVVPEFGARVSQLTFELAVQLTGELPEVILRLWLGGLGPPCAAVKARLVGLAERMPPVIVRPTGTDRLGTPGAESVIVNCENVPPDKPVMSTETLVVPGVVPEVWLKLIRLVLALMVH